MQAAVGAIRQEDSILLALVVLARKPLTRHAGTVSSVDTIDGTFTLRTRSGEALTFAVDENTRFRSLGGWLHGLEDLQEGMHLAVGAVALDGGGYMARLVVATRRPSP